MREYVGSQRRFFIVVPVDATSEGGGLVEAESRGEKRGVIEEPDEILDGLVAHVR